jgi:outer membrane protein OmpA-like peptidoglycan-associated protein
MNTIQLLYKLYLPKLSYTLALPLLILLVGCGGPLVNNPLLTNATTEYKKAEQDTMIVKYAPVALKEAEESLEISRKFWTAKADKSAIEHHAYIAQQKTFIAIETAAFNAATSEISRSELERQQVLLDVRRSEADRSEARAESALSEAKSERALADIARENADQSRQLAMDSEERAKKLAQRVNELEARPTDRGLVLTLGDVLFESGKSTLRLEGMKSMDNLADFLVEYPERKIMIEGFTDNIGGEAFNMELSKDRANSVKSALISRKISANRINIIGYGFKFPVASNEMASGRQKNRRVEIIISDQKGNISARDK